LISYFSWCKYNRKIGVEVKTIKRKLIGQVLGTELINDSPNLAARTDADDRLPGALANNKTTVAENVIEANCRCRNETL